MWLWCAVEVSLSVLVFAYTIMTLALYLSTPKPPWHNISSTTTNSILGSTPIQALTCFIGHENVQPVETE